MVAKGGERWGSVLGGGRLGVFLLICGGIWLHAADSLIVATVMPSVVAELGGIAWTGWALALYEIGSIVAGAAGGLIAARHGVGRALAMAASLFGLGCAASGLAPDMALFLGGRLLQGVGGGALVALCHVAVTRAFAERHWTRLYAAISGVWGASALAGPLIGGLFAEAGLWRGAFLVFAGQAALLVALAPRLLRGAKRGGQEPVAPPAIAALLALVLGVLGVAGAAVLPSAGLAALAGVAGLLALACFLRLDARAAGALLPHRALKMHGQVRAGYLMVILLSIASVSFTVYGPLLLARLHGLGPLAAGYLVSLEAVTWSLAALAVGGVGPQGEGRWLRLGGSAIVVGLLGFAVTVPGGSLWLIGLSAALQGGGFGLCWAFVVRRIVTAAEERERERAAGAVPTLQMLGYALGAAAAGIVANGLGFSLEAELATVSRVAVWIFLAFLPLALVGLAATWRLARE